MKNNYKQGILIAVCLLGVTLTAWAQSYSIIDSKANDMKLSGTSSMHNWDMNAHAFTSDAQFEFKEGEELQLAGLSALSFSLPVQNLKSDKNGLDKNAYKALNTSQHKNIVYKLLSATVSPEKENKFLIKTNGNLTIAGVTKEVDMDVYCHVNQDSTISCSGSDKLKMTDYQVKPPSFMFGAMTTGDDVTLDFTVVYKD